MKTIPEPATKWIDRNEQRCLVCGKQIGWRKRLDAKTCSTRCRKHLSRHGQGSHISPAGEV